MVARLKERSNEHEQYKKHEKHSTNNITMLKVQTSDSNEH